MPKLAIAIAASVMLLSANMLSSDDSMFASQAAHSNIAEIELGRLALARASAQDVKNFAQRMVDDHTRTADDLNNLAAEIGETLPSTLTDTNRAQLAHLSTLEGMDFDRAYMTASVDSHRDALTLFETETASGDNPVLKKFAAKSLPILKEHFEMAKRIADSVGVTE
jgi:putative membrane protein